MRLVALLALVFVLAGAGPIRCGDDPTPALEAEKADFLARTVPKAEFWGTVERKGQLVKQEKEIAGAAEEIAAKAGALEQEIVAAEAELSTARGARERAEASLEQARSELAHAKSEQQTREERLRTFAQRQAAGDGS
jgi:hypothetical protein